MTTDKNARLKRMIVGLGMSGLSCARFCQRQGWSFDLCDSREQPTNLSSVQQEFSHSRVVCGPLQGELLASYDELIVSPGVALSEPAIQQAIAAGVTISGDIQLFKQFVNKPVIAITGSNGKSTVTTLVGDILNACGLKALVGGNIGLPALDLTLDSAADVYVLELSSFQLETTTDLGACAATILNLSEDHMDRYSGMADYLAAKQRIFQQAAAAVVNRDDQASQPQQELSQWSFGEQTNAGQQAFGLLQQDGQDWICYAGEPLLSATDIKIKGRHNLANVMAALALVAAAAPQLNINWRDGLEAVRQFAGLAHRCQWVANINGVDCYNDSKGTNVGSTLAAINGLGKADGKIWLLAGGVDKDQSFNDLVKPCQQFVAEVLLFGRDASAIAEDLQGCKTRVVNTLDQAFGLALKAAQPGDVILLSPACASFDQFKNYAVRGEYFCQLVKDAEVSYV